MDDAVAITPELSSGIDVGNEFAHSVEFSDVLCDSQISCTP